MTPSTAAAEHTGFVGNLNGSPDVLVPPEICDALGIEPGDNVEFVVRDDEVVMRRADR